MRLISWNIHKGIGGRDRKYSLQRIIDCIEVENPDLICLQEVDRLVHRSHFDDQPRLLAHYFHYHSIFQPTVHVGVGTYGNLLLSRWPIESRHRITLQQGLRKDAEMSISDGSAKDLSWALLNLYQIHQELQE